MLRPDTHFEQVPLEVVKSLVQEEIHEDENAAPPPDTKETVSHASLQGKG
jgi:hypothetical protein